MSPETLPEAASWVQGLCGNGPLGPQPTTLSSPDFRWPWTSGSTWRGPKLFHGGKDRSPSRGWGGRPHTGLRAELMRHVAGPPTGGHSYKWQPSRGSGHPLKGPAPSTSVIYFQGLVQLPAHLPLREQVAPGTASNGCWFLPPTPAARPCPPLCLTECSSWALTIFTESAGFQTASPGASEWVPGVPVGLTFTSTWTVRPYEPSLVRKSPEAEITQRFITQLHIIKPFLAEALHPPPHMHPFILLIYPFPVSLPQLVRTTKASGVGVGGLLFVLFMSVSRAQQ